VTVQIALLLIGIQQGNYRRIVAGFLQMLQGGKAVLVGGRTEQDGIIP